MLNQCTANKQKAKIQHVPFKNVFFNMYDASWNLKGFDFELDMLLYNLS